MNNQTAFKSSNTTRIALVMLTIAYALNFIDRQILVILQESIKADMGLSDVQLGLLSGFSFAVVYITAGIPIAYWADRGNRKNIIALAVAVWSGMTALSGLAANYTQLLLARIGVGIGEAGGSPPAHAMISDYYPPHRRAGALSIYSMGLHFGILLGFLFGGIISEMFGWRMAFMAVGIPGILFAIVFYFVVQEPERGRWETASAAAYKPTLRETMSLLKSYRSFWYIAAGTGFAAFVGYGNGNFAPSYLIRSHGFSTGEVGVILAFFGGGAGMVGALLGGYLADHLGTRDKRWYVWLPAIASLLSVPMAFPYLLLDNPYLVIASMFVTTALVNTYLGPCLAISHTMVPPAMRALVSAVLFFILNLIGLGLGPLTAGALSDWFSQTHGPDGLRYAMLVVAMIGGVAVVMFMLAARHLRADLEKLQST